MAYARDKISEGIIQNLRESLIDKCEEIRKVEVILCVSISFNIVFFLLSLLMFIKE